MLGGVGVMLGGVEGVVDGVEGRPEGHMDGEEETWIISE